jgi:hypothetical protein
MSRKTAAALDASLAVGCVAKRGEPVTLLRINADGEVKPGIQVPVRAVAAYQYAGLTVCAGPVTGIAVPARPLVTSWPWWLHAGLGVLVTLAAWLLVAMVSDVVWSRLVESLVTDTASAILTASTAADPPPRTDPA